MNMVAHLLRQFACVYFFLFSSTFLPNCPASSTNFPSAQAEPGRGWNNQILCQPNTTIRGNGPP